MSDQPSNTPTPGTGGDGSPKGDQPMAEQGEAAEAGKDEDAAFDPKEPTQPIGDIAGATRVGTPSDVWVSFALTLLVILYILRALTYPPEARLLPIVTALPALLILGGVTFKTMTLRRRAMRDPDSVVEHSPRAVAEADDPTLVNLDAINARKSLAWVAAAMFVPMVFGFVIGTPLFLLFYLRIQGEESYLFTLIYTAIFSGFVYWFFVEWVSIRPFEGLLDLPSFLGIG